MHSMQHSWNEEIANVITHGFGVIASLIGAAVLVILALSFGDAWHVVSAIVYGASLIILYSASTLYHAARDKRAKTWLEIFDHCAIFILIAGTYTPFTLVTLRESLGWSLFAIVWGLAVAGIMFKLFFTRRFRLLSTLFYLAMGWLALFAFEPMMRILSPEAITLLVIGGVAYTGGTFFYHNKRIRYSHAIWHLFVLVGSACHFGAVVMQMLPQVA